MAASEPQKKSASRSRGSRGDGASTSRRRTNKGNAAWAIRSAVEQLQELLGRAPESVSAVKATENGWEADVEVLELERVPETTSVMATYRVTLDEEGDLVGYERKHRYTRGQIDRRG
ncbi:gas vesicle protein [Streptomyces mangrovisoli]|uniref:Gas vesicle protein n=1 Tax=Streptomyces mangrovisoli TaxID=1428628 RepID=A0A1J4P1N3_9ACTN|nr:gas vesicle protein [Streptomyces mangrovisoli]OIJ68480.1 gas vesicle protein [Streptomyces mangrovisoli]